MGWKTFIIAFYFSDDKKIQRGKMKFMKNTYCSVYFINISS